MARRHHGGGIRVAPGRLVYRWGGGGVVINVDATPPPPNTRTPYPPPQLRNPGLAPFG